MTQEMARNLLTAENLAFGKYVPLLACLVTFHQILIIFAISVKFCLSHMDSFWLYSSPKAWQLLRSVRMRMFDDVSGATLYYH